MGKTRKLSKDELSLINLIANEMGVEPEILMKPDHYTNDQIMTIAKFLWVILNKEQVKGYDQLEKILHQDQKAVSA